MAIRSGNEITARRAPIRRGNRRADPPPAEGSCYEEDAAATPSFALENV